AGVESAPDNHLSASPHRRVVGAACRRVRGACRGPTVHCGIVPAASVQPTTAPYYHFGTCPHCRVCAARGRRVGGAGCCPRTRAWVVSAPGVEWCKRIPKTAAPDDHLTASPDCRV